MKEESKIDSVDDSVPLTINYYKFLLEEKKQNILQLARVKVEEAQFLIFRDILDHCDQNITYEFKNSNQFSLKDIQSASPGVTEEDIEPLISDSCKFLKKFGDLYSINWENLQTIVQNTLMESIAESTLGPYHARIIRIFKMKGYLNEVDLTSMCLLPPRDARAALNALIKEGYVQHYQVPVTI